MFLSAGFKFMASAQDGGSSTETIITLKKFGNLTKKNYENINSYKQVTLPSLGNGGGACAGGEYGGASPSTERNGSSETTLFDKSNVVPF